MNRPVWILCWIRNLKEEMRNVYDKRQMDGNADERIQTFITNLGC